MDCIRTYPAPYRQNGELVGDAWIPLITTLGAQADVTYMPKIVHTRFRAKAVRIFAN